jgi:Uma2 family endonuclease
MHMAALSEAPLISVEDYLTANYPDGDREYLDGVVVERQLGTPAHSALQKILIVHLAQFEKVLRIAVRPSAARESRKPDIECRTCSSWSGRSGRSIAWFSTRLY